MSDKDQLAQEIVKKYATYAAGAGLIPIPTLDMATIAGVELKMLHELSKVYGVEFKNDRVRPIVAALIGGYASTNLGTGAGGSLLKAVPIFGQVLGTLAVPAFAAGLTWAIGRVFIQHFASGGTFLDFDPAKVRDFYKTQKASAA
jgi:uncharacterized protein (DUF697 family)